MSRLGSVHRAPRGLSGLALVVVALLVTTPATAQPGYDLDEVIASARIHNPTLQGNQARVDAALAARDKNLGHYGPKLILDSNVRVWNEEQVLSLGGGGAVDLPPPMTPYEEVVAGLIAGFGEPTTIQDQITAQFTISVVQPLTPLLDIDDGLDALDTQVELAELSNTRLERQAALQASQAYFRSLQAESLALVQQESFDRLTVELEQLDALVAGDIASEHDRLRLQVALASAEQQLIRANSDVELARASLALAMGLDLSDPVAAEAPARVGVPEPPASIEQAYQVALDNRVELVELERQIQLADIGVENAELAMYPDLNLQAAYTHTEGQGLANADSFFAGLSLTWVLWEWGASWYGIDEAESQAEIVRSQRLVLERQIRLQVESAWRSLRATVDSLQVAELAESQAADAYALERLRYESGISTTTDLLAAEAAVTEARLNRQAALYQALLENATLIDALGLDLSADTILP